MLFILVLGIKVYQGIFAETYNLDKNEWVCTQQKEQQMIIQAGKVPVLTKIVSCVKYEHI